MPKRRCYINIDFRPEEEFRYHVWIVFQCTSSVYSFEDRKDNYWYIEYSQNRNLKNLYKFLSTLNHKYEFIDYYPCE